MALTASSATQSRDHARAGLCSCSTGRSPTPHLGSSYTVKIYESTKRQDPTGEWSHVHVTLKPDSLDSVFEAIHLTDVDEESEVLVVAELIEILSG